MKVHKPSWALRSTQELSWVWWNSAVISQKCPSHHDITLFTSARAKVPWSWVLMASQGWSVVFMAPRHHAHECLWLFISAIHVFLATHGYTWVLMSPHEQPWVAMDTTEQPWLTMNTHENGTLRTHRHSWAGYHGEMSTYENSWHQFPIIMSAPEGFWVLMSAYKR